MVSQSIDPYRVYTTPQAAALLNVSEVFIVTACKSGKLKGRLIGRGWKILGENLLRFLGSSSPSLDISK